MDAEIVNKVANSGLISFDLEDYFHQGDRVVYDIKDNLFMGLILKEKDFISQFLLLLIRLSYGHMTTIINQIEEN
jgi:hypothetical protein